MESTFICTVSQRFTRNNCVVAALAEIAGIATAVRLNDFINHQQFPCVVAVLVPWGKGAGA
eukprot:1716505-Pyramimonas_sp.AAC.1